MEKKGYMDDKRLLMTIRTLLSQQINAFETLDSLLINEYDALRAGDPEKINEISSRKSELVNHIEQLNKERESHVHGNHGALRQRIIGLDPGNKTHTTDLLDQLFVIVRRCYHKNCVNGAVVHVCTRFAKQALTVLHGNTPDDTAQLTYGPSGQTDADSASYSITRA
jgi:flagellar biosynthesis/type III secretory pathway chaperone